MKLLAESVRSVLSQPVASSVTALIIGGACAAILSTTGQTVRAEQDVLALIDDAGTRSIVITDTDGTAGIKSTAVSRINRLAGVEWALGLGPASDVTAVPNSAGNPAVIRTIYGALPPQIDATREIGGFRQALVGRDAQRTLGLLHPFGGVAGIDQYAVVGGFISHDPLAFLNAGLITESDEVGTVRSVHILAADPAQVTRIAEATLNVLAAENFSAVSVETSAALAEVRAAVKGELGEYGRQLITFVLAAGLVLTALSVFGAVTNRRRDFGRRRALGASRAFIVALVAIQTGIAALVGAFIGSAVTIFLLKAATGTSSDLRFTVAITVLAVITATFAALPPAIAAAYRDPVRVLRVP